MTILTKHSFSALIAGSALMASLAFAGTALAANSDETGSMMKNPNGFIHNGQNMPRPAVVGTVATAPDRNGTFTVTAKTWQRGDSPGANTPMSATTYTVTTTSATTVTKSSAASTVSAIAVGDTVMVSGTVSGIQVTATAIRDGAMSGRPDMEKISGLKPNMEMASHTPIITGNGQPVIGGNVTAMNGNSVTVTNKSNVTYTVDVTNAIITKPGVTGATAASIAIGDSVVIQGTVNGNSIVAASVIDQAKPGISNPEGGEHRGFMGAIGGFFAHLFGF